MTRLIRLIGALGVALALTIGLLGVSTPAKADARLKVPAAAASQVPAKVVTDTANRVAPSGRCRAFHNTWCNAPQSTGSIMVKATRDGYVRYVRPGYAFPSGQHYLRTQRQSQQVCNYGFRTRRCTRNVWIRITSVPVINSRYWQVYNR